MSVNACTRMHSPKSFLLFTYSVCLLILWEIHTMYFNHVSHIPQLCLDPPPFPSHSIFNPFFSKPHEFPLTLGYVAFQWRMVVMPGDIYTFKEIWFFCWKWSVASIFQAKGRTLWQPPLSMLGLGLAWQVLHMLSQPLWFHMCNCHAESTKCSFFLDSGSCSLSVPSSNMTSEHCDQALWQLCPI